MASPATDKLVERARAAFASGGTPQLLDSITWPRSVERSFFAQGAEKQPEPAYEVDYDAVRERIARLDAFETELSGDDALVRLLRSTVNSQRLGARMLLALGTRAFYDIAREVYGGASSTWLDGDTTNLDFAEHIARRIGSAAPEGDGDATEGPLDAEALAKEVTERLAKRRKAPGSSLFTRIAAGTRARSPASRCGVCAPLHPALRRSFPEAAPADKTRGPSAA